MLLMYAMLYRNGKTKQRPEQYWTKIFDFVCVCVCVPNGQSPALFFMEFVMSMECSFLVWCYLCCCLCLTRFPMCSNVMRTVPTNIYLFTEWFFLHESFRVFFSRSYVVVLRDFSFAERRKKKTPYHCEILFAHIKYTSFNFNLRLIECLFFVNGDRR